MYICCIIIFQVYKYHKNLQIDHFLTAFVILALALVIGLGIGHFLGRLSLPPCSSQGQPNSHVRKALRFSHMLHFGHLGLFFSVTTSIHSSLFGLAPDPFEQSLEMGLDQGMEDSVGGLDGIYPVQNKKKYKPTPVETENNNVNQMSGGEFIHEPLENEEGSFSILGAIKNVFTRLGTKLGYIRKSPNSKSVVHGTTLEEYYEFQCMTADDQPILVSGQPVMVSDPHACQQYYTEGQGAGYASVTEPPPVFMELARGTFKSKDVVILRALNPGYHPIVIYSVPN